MEIKQLQAVVTVAEVGSVTKAAQQLHVVQPAVTRYIRSLEDELGLDLFVRTRHGMQLTTAGVTMVERARRALAELDRARAELRPESGHVTGIVSVGLLESLAELIAEPLCHAVKERFSGIELRLMTAYSGHLQQWLDDGDLDVSLLYNTRASPSLRTQPLVQESLWAVAGPTAGLRLNEAVGLAQLSEKPVVAPVSGHGLRIVIDSACARAGIKLDIAVATNSLVLQRQLVAAGYGWSVLPPSAVIEDVLRGRLSAAPLTDPALTRQIVLGLPRSDRRAPAVDAVARVLAEQVETAVLAETWPAAVLAEDWSRPDAGELRAGD